MIVIVNGVMFLDVLFIVSLVPYDNLIDDHVCVLQVHEQKKQQSLCRVSYSSSSDNKVLSRNFSFHFR